MRRTSGRRGSTDLLTGASWALDAAGAVFVADSNTNRVRKISPDGTITTVAGRGLAAYSAPNGDGGQATDAVVRPAAVTVDSLGYLYIADSGNFRTQKVLTDGRATTIAGNGSPGHSGDGGLALDAQLLGPTGLAVDADGNVYACHIDAIRVLKPVIP
jgi:hypothetical protein